MFSATAIFTDLEGRTALWAEHATKGCGPSGGPQPAGESDA